MKGKRRGLEAVKSLLILLLSVSAVALLIQTPLVQDSGVLNLLKPGQQAGPGRTEVTLTAAARPSRMAVGSEENRYGVQYDQSEVDSLFTRFGPLLGEALVSSAQPEPIAESNWKYYLRGESVYFDFTGDIPLSALSSWLKPEGICGLTATARRVVLADGQGDTVLLCYQDSSDDRFYACRTDLVWSLHLEPSLADVTGNGAGFAFENKALSPLLQPYTLITEEVGREIYQVSVPVSPNGNLSWLLEALDYTGRNHASVSDGELYLDGNDRLHILTGGEVRYNAAQGGKYPVVTSGSTMALAETIEAARKLAEATIGMQCGDAELYLMSARETSDGCQIQFGYRLDGSTVWLHEEGWAAEFYVRDGYITDFTLYFCNYVSTGNEALLLSMDRAVNMLPDVTDEKSELTIQYRGQSEIVEPVWIAK